MKLITRYILEEFLKALVGCLVLFVCLFCVIDLFEQLDDITKAQTPLFVLYDYYSSLVPAIFVQISPLIIMLATMTTLHTMQRYHEIIALKAIGIDLWNAFSVFFLCGILLSGASFAVNELVKPQATAHAQSLKERYMKQRLNPHDTPLLHQVAFFGANNRLFIIQTYDTQRHHMENITISASNRNNVLISRVSARRAQWAEGYWIFYDTIESRYKDGLLDGEPERHAEKIYFLDETPDEITRATDQPDMMSFWRLKRFIRQLRENGLDVRKELVALNQKIAFPLANIILVFFAVPFSVSRVRSANALLGFTVSLVIGFSYWGVNAVCVSLANSGMLPPWVGAWLTNTLFFLAGFALLAGVSR